MTDPSELVERCRRGDALAWEMLVRRYQGRVYSLAWHYLRNAEEARDVAQDVFVRVWQRLDGYDGSAAFLAWLLRVARNASIDRLRRRAARPPAADVELDGGIELASRDPGPDEHAGAEDRRRLLYRAMEEMSDHHREMILLKEIQGLKLEEIASMLGLPVGTVKSRSNRARLELATRVRALAPGYGA